ncbi:MAG: hypothetical protein L0Y71_09750 [Gemmataceae bacterium]|nr:hypothetical protein [Gemmataceae bacterium]
MSADDSVPRERLRALQIIAMALPMGALAFFGVVVFMVYGAGNPQPAAANALPVISMVAGAFLLITGPMSFVMPAAITQAGLKQIAAGGEHYDLTRLLGLKQTAMIVGMALLEGTAFLGLIAFLVERQPAVLAVPALALAGMLMRFPTQNSVRNWMEQHGRRVLELRQDRQS